MAKGLDTSLGEDAARSRIYGLEVEAPYLFGRPSRRDRPADVVVKVEDGDYSVSELTCAETIARHPAESPAFWIQRVDDGSFRYLFRDLIDLQVSSDWSQIVARTSGPSGRDLLPVLLGGHVFSSLLLLRGELVLHASAVEVDGRAIALVGASGAGKSTLAAMCCQAGARLVSDDVLRVETSGTQVVSYQGATQLRLRSTSKALSEPEGGLEPQVSSDGRHLFAPEATNTDMLPLVRIILPRLRPPEHPTVCTELDKRSAFLTLLGLPRIPGWRHPTTSRTHFDLLGDVVQRVRVDVLELPWGLASNQSTRRYVDEILGE